MLACGRMKAHFVFYVNEGNVWISATTTFFCKIPLLFLLSDRHWSKWDSHIIFFISCGHPMRKIFLLASFYRWGKIDSERYNILPNVTQLMNGRAGYQIQACLYNYTLFPPQQIVFKVHSSKDRKFLFFMLQLQTAP